MKIYLKRQYTTFNAVGLFHVVFMNGHANNFDN